MKIIFHSRANKTHFHKKVRTPSLILKVRVFGTRKWSIQFSERKRKVKTQVNPLMLAKFSAATSSLGTMAEVFEFW